MIGPQAVDRYQNNVRVAWPVHITARTDQYYRQEQRGRSAHASIQASVLRHSVTVAIALTSTNRSMQAQNPGLVPRRCLDHVFFPESGNLGLAHAEQLAVDLFIVLA